MIGVLLFLLCQSGWANTPIVVKDFRPEWMEHMGGDYQRLGSISVKDLHTIYFELRALDFKGQYLSVNSGEDWDLFVNGKLIFAGHEKVFSVDSLSSLYTPELFIGIHSAEGIGDLSTAIVFPPQYVVTQLRERGPRPPTFFRDYAILAAAFLLLFLLGLFKTNPQLTLDYFSFAKIFSVQERNENLLASRITSSVNLLFYLFCALLTGFLLSSVFYFAGAYFPASKFIGIDSFGGAFLTWSRLSFYILLLLASKLVVVLFFSSLFNFRETVSFQFFNFLRFVLFTAVMMTILSLIYFVFKGGQPLFYKQLIVLALALMSAGSVMVLIKLLARAPFSFFHLFSYLCVSEIIPLVIIIKIFF